MMAAIARRQAQESVIDIGPEANDQRRHVDQSVLGGSTQHTKRSVRPLTACKDVVREELDTESSETQFRTALAMRSP